MKTKLYDGEEVASEFNYRQCRVQADETRYFGQKSEENNKEN